MYIGTPKILNDLLVIRKMFIEEGVDTSRIDDKIHQEKLGLRNLYRESEDHKRHDYEWHPIGDGFDSIYGKYVFDWEMDSEEISELVEDEWCHWYNPYNDGRDCTGVWFTTSIRCLPINGKTFVYHFKSCDV